MRKRDQRPVGRLDIIDNVDIIGNIDDVAFAPPSRCAGFTILELASVLAILVLIIGAATGAFLGWQRAAAVRGGADQVCGALLNARQFAIANRVPTGLAIGMITNAVGSYPYRTFFVAFTNGNAASSPFELDYRHGVLVTAPGYLPLRSVVTVSGGGDDYDANSPDDPFVIKFLPDGRAQATLDDEPIVVLVGTTRDDGASVNLRAFTLHPLTGLPQSVELEEAP